KMDLVLVPPKTHGNFYKGDCYVLLSTRKLGSILSYDVHYWIGSCSSQNEQGSAAIYTIQLDDYLGGVPVQHREVQGYESELFKGYFKKGIIYKKGGRASGFNHTETNAYNVKRLLHVKGKRNVMAREVEISWDSFNLGDVFLLDLGKIIVQWNGPESNKQERLKGDDEEASSDLMKVLESELGERTRKIKPAISDEIVDQQHKTSLFLYCVTDSGGQIEITEEAKRPLRQELLNHNKGYSSSTNVETVHDGAESAMFKQLFQNWTVQEQTVGLGIAHNVERIAKVSQERFDIMALHALPQLAAQERMVDDGEETLRSGGLRTWSWYKWTNNGMDFSMGRHATVDELAASAYLAVQMDQQFNGEPMQVRVNMGKEPQGDDEEASSDLMKVLESELGERTQKSNLPFLMRYTQTNQTSNLVFFSSVTDSGGQIEITEEAKRPLRQELLNHNDCYILDHSGMKIYVWKGKGATKLEKQTAMSKALKGYSSSTNVETVHDGAESAMFKQLFQNWTVQEQTVSQERFDIMALHALPQLAAQERMVDDGEGNVEVWRIENLELVQVDKQWHGFFYGGDCYLILSGGENIRIIGRHATVDELAASAYLAVQMISNSMGNLCKS
ncbi:hypothetical protein E2320_016234, partial [Naja naja]